MKAKRSSLYSFIMLAVFLPAWLSATLHTHTHIDPQETECFDCLHRHPHAGHLSPENGDLSVCLLCRFLSLPSIVGSLMTMDFVHETGNALQTFLRILVSTDHSHPIQSRAPPFSFCF